MEERREERLFDELAESLPRQRSGSFDGDRVPARRLYRPREVWEMLNISRDMLFDILRSRELRSIKVGRLRLIPAEAIDEYVAKKLAEEEPEKAG